MISDYLTATKIPVRSLRNNWKKSDSWLHHKLKVGFIFCPKATSLFRPLLFRRREIDAFIYDIETLNYFRRVYHKDDFEIVGKPFAQVSYAVAISHKFRNEGSKIRDCISSLVSDPKYMKAMTDEKVWIREVPGLLVQTQRVSFIFPIISEANSCFPFACYRVGSFFIFIYSPSEKSKGCYGMQKWWIFIS